MASLKEIQKSFIDSIYNNEELACQKLIKDSDVSKSSRIDIYRNNSIATLRETLKNRYPTLIELVGEDFFKYCSNEYIKQYPSISGNLDEYGKEFSLFIENFQPAKGLPYLKDIAILEQSLHEAYFAKDSKSFDQMGFSKIELEKLGKIKLKLNPSCYLINSKFPINQIYLMAKGQSKENVNINSGGENILIYRPKFKIQQIIINDAEYIFLKLLNNSYILEESFNESEKVDSKFDVGKALIKFIELGVFSEFYS